jgi:mono/diheme cytochrome c family protein
VVSRQIVEEPMRNTRRALPFAAALLLVAGCGDSAGLGKSIYETASGAEGPLQYTAGPDWLRFTAVGCAVCHGESGEGLTARAGEVVGTAPPIAYRQLAEKGYSEEQVRRAITEGLAHDGRPLHYYMPRWAMTEEELDAIVEHLKGLSG